MARRHKKEVYYFHSQLKECKTFGQFMATLSKFGATEVGEGSTRKAWRWKDYVIKICFWDYDEQNLNEVMIESEDNLSELKTYLNSDRVLKKMMARVYSDLSAKNGSFIFMEYLSRSDFRYSDVEKYMSSATKAAKRKRVNVPYCIMHDSHPGNFRRKNNGQLVMIDLQSYW